MLTSYLYIALKVIVVGFTVLRLVRWLALVQQKEYRWDRLWLFLKSTEGKQELFRLVPLHPLQLALTSLKRPVRSLRMLLTATLCFCLLGLLLHAFQWTLTGLVGVFLAVPLLVWLVVLPTLVMKELITIWFMGQARRQLKKNQTMIIGVTGSYGKTSTKQLLAHVLAKKFSIFVTPYSHNTRYSVAKSILRLFKQPSIAIIEYAAYTKGEIKKLAYDLPPNHSIITGIAPQHLGLFGSLSAIIKAKSELVLATKPMGTIFYNGADQAVQGLVFNDAHRHNDVSTFPITSHLDTDGKLIISWEDTVIPTQVIGTHYLLSVKIAIAVALQLGLTKRQIIQGLKSFHPTTNFIRTYSSAKHSLIVDDGATSNPQGFEAVISLAKHLKKTHNILVTSGIVDLGDQSSAIHKLLATNARMVFDKVFYLGLDGSEEFQQVFAKDMITDQDSIQKQLTTIDESYLVVIEGHLRQEILALLQPQ